eukprot:TRINITY_DN4245_c0_g1_i12.p11 TRINITY_DN4245_c0_g1~~TRINITY_DN4245_c0_g1_i12.p11  ORF type:complete len:110 (+),score=3.00 TRINITY_DN4245_c0_g1_i12:2326-2655(+)
MLWLSDDMCQVLTSREYLGKKYQQPTVTNITYNNIQYNTIVQQFVSLQYISQVLQQLYKEEQQKVGSYFMLQKQLQDENLTTRIRTIKITNLRGELYFLKQQVFDRINF